MAGCIWGEGFDFVPPASLPALFGRRSSLRLRLRANSDYGTEMFFGFRAGVDFGLWRECWSSEPAGRQRYEREMLRFRWMFDCWSGSDF
jgi:hypothetical protein